MIARVGRKEQSRDERRGKKRDGFRFKYKARTSEDVKKRAEQSAGNFDSPIKRGFDMWRPKSGENVIRILPPTWKDFDHYGYDVFMHRFVGSDNSNYICPNKMKGKPCCMCDEAKQLKADGEEDEAKQIGFQKRVWVWIIDRDDKNAMPQIWDMSWSQDRTISEQSTYKGGKVLLIDHPDEGFDVIVKKTGSGKTGTKYTFTIERDPSPISDDQDKQDEILQYITENPVPTVFKIYDDEYLQKKMEGTSSSKDDDLDEDEEDEKPRNRRRRSRDEDEEQDDPPRRKRSRDAEDEDEEDAAPRRGRRGRDEEEEDEEDDPPPRRKRASRDAEEDEEDEEDERPRRRSRSRDEEEDEEEDDPPPRRKKSKSRDEEDEEDEDEEDRPRRKKSRSRDEEEDEDEDDRPRRRR